MTVRIRVKAVPGSSKSSVQLMGDLIKVRVQAPPEKGKANTAIEKLLADALQLPPSAVKVTSGHTSPLKTVSIEGIDEARVLSLLGESGN
jgi:uncharacterized protein (TIGR00251 family)